MPRKNKNKGRAGHGRSRTVRTVRSVTSNLEGKVPTQWEELKHVLNPEFPTVYSRYKKATNRFIEYMTKICPSEMGEGGSRSTSSLLAAADWMAGTGHGMERSVLRDLKLAIRIRTRVAKSVYGGGDAGHKHFLNVLIYCWFFLNALPKSTKENDGSKPRGEEDTNHYAALVMEDDEDEEDDEEMFPSNPVARPVSSGPELLSLDELLKSDDRHDSNIFFMTLNELMGSIAQQYQCVLRNHRRYQNRGIAESGIVEYLMEAAVTTNMAIQQVRKLEMELMVQHEHLTTPYRLLATMVFPEITRDLTAIVREHAAIEGCTEKDIIMYLGDCMESYLRNPSDPYNRKDDIVKEFCCKWQLDSVGTGELEETWSALQQWVVYEVPAGLELDQRARAQSLVPTLPKSHDWFKTMQYIGGDRAIHHTLRLLQMFGHVIHRTSQDSFPEPRRGIFGKSPWVAGRSRKIHGDLDELLMADILPQMVIMCRKGIIGVTKLPREDELCPLFVMLREYVEAPEKPVSWSITFAIHALLTAVLEVDPIFNNLVEVTKTAFDNYFFQIKSAQGSAKDNPEIFGGHKSEAGKLWWHNMVSMSFLENLGLPVFGDRMLWNPLFAGTTLSYLNYFGNIETGCTLIDCHAQLRITLHLYHALLVNGIFVKGHNPLLDTLYDYFRNSKAIWEGRRLPERGEFVQRFWICFGENIGDARKKAGEAKKTIFETQWAQQRSNKPIPWKGTRKLSPIEPAEVSKSYRRICKRDFHDVVDKYHTPEQRRREKGTEQYQFAVRVNDTLDAMEKEQDLMCLNLPSLAAIIEEFVNRLGRFLKWEPLLAIYSKTSEEAVDKRQNFAYLFAQYVLGALDFADDPYRYEFLQVPLGAAASRCMGPYFGNLDFSRAIWFQAVVDE
jgi:hypothetical protein